MGPYRKVSLHVYLKIVILILHLVFHVFRHLLNAVIIIGYVVRCITCDICLMSYLYQVMVLCDISNSQDRWFVLLI